MPCICFGHHESVNGKSFQQVCIPSADHIGRHFKEFNEELRQVETFQPVAFIRVLNYLPFTMIYVSAQKIRESKKRLF